MAGLYKGRVNAMNAEYAELAQNILLQTLSVIMHNYFLSFFISCSRMNAPNYKVFLIIS